MPAKNLNHTPGNSGFIVLHGFMLWKMNVLSIENKNESSMFGSYPAIVLPLLLQEH